MSTDVKTAKFRALELNERNVDILFNRCLPTGEELKNWDLMYPTQVLIPELTGRESQRIFLSKEKIEANRNTILYLLGQIKSFHSDKKAFVLQEGFIKYDGTVWTEDYGTLFKLYHLALSSALMSDFALTQSKICAIRSHEIIPTLSPRDPNYAAWWEEHKSEWE